MKTARRNLPTKQTVSLVADNEMSLSLFTSCIVLNNALPEKEDIVMFTWYSELL